MFEILKRALDEALTSAYAAELPAGAEEPAFSEDFEREMRVLIRKTDRPFQKYVRFLTAAACAAIAVGCAVLLPRLLSSSVPVEPPVETVATDTSSAPIDEPVESSSTAGTVPDAPDEIRDENPNAAGGEVDTTTWDDDNASGVNGVPVVTGSSIAATDPAPQDTDEPPATETSVREENTADDGDDDADYYDDDDDADHVTIDDDADYGDDDDDDSIDIEEDDDADYGDDDDDADYGDDDDVGGVYDSIDDEDDDDVGYDSEEDDSDDDDVAYDEDESDTTDAPPTLTIEKRPTLRAEVQTLLGCSLADSYVHSGSCTVDGRVYDLPIIKGISPEAYRDPALAKLLGQAKRTDPPAVPGEPMLKCSLGKEPPAIAPLFEKDFSDRNRYEQIYFGAPDSDDMDVEDYDLGEAATISLSIDRNGVVTVSGNLYRDSAYYRLDGGTLEKLIERIEARFRVSEPKTVGDLSKQLGAAEDYAQIYVGIRGYYDCTMYGELSDGSFFAELLQKYKKTKLREAAYRSGAPIQIAVTSRKSLREYNFMFYADGTVRLLSGETFTIDPSELRAVLAEYCKQKGLPAPVFYENLGEYLADKNFTELTAVRFYAPQSGEYILLDGDDAQTRAAITESMTKSPLLPGGTGVMAGTRGNIEIRLKGWSVGIRINAKEIQIGNTRNIFRTPDGLYERLCAIVTERGTVLNPGEEWDIEIDEEIDD